LSIFILGNNLPSMLLRYKTQTNVCSRGFTMVELLIAIAIAILLLSAAMSLQGNYGASSQLYSANIQVLQTLRIAREKSIAGLNNSPHGVFFEHNAIAKDRIILYQGTSYALRDPLYDREVVFPLVLSVSSTLTNNDITFSRGMGIPNNIGTITLTHEGGINAVLSVNILGVVNEE
jgi:prepilin-type N-terminal cleavage/methylation domain-containing protein